MAEVTLTAQQKKLAQEFDRKQAEEAARQQHNLEMLGLLDKECENIAKFLKNKVKLRPTLLMDQITLGASKKDVDMPIDYFLGKDIHFIIITHRKEILAIAKEIQARRDLHGLEKIEDSMHLLGVLANFKKVVKLAPHHLQYPDPKASDARRPKRVEILPDNQQIIETGGFYMFTVKTNTFKRALLLGLGVVLGMLVLLWRVWPMWLRIGVWYASYYLAVTLVSLFNELTFLLRSQLQSSA